MQLVGWMQLLKWETLYFGNGKQPGMLASNHETTQVPNGTIDCSKKGSASNKMSELIRRF